jgi:plastocyanin
VTSLAAGTYTIMVNDQATNHNFHLSGPGGVDQLTTQAFVGQVTWTVTLVAGTYIYKCDPHYPGMDVNQTAFATHSRFARAVHLSWTAAL